MFLLLPFPAAAAPLILVLGDSLSSGYGLPAGSGWVDLLQERLQAQKFPHQVVNASISGDTALGGRNRINSALATHRPAIVIVQLGGNDGLRGHSPEATRDNLAAIIEACRQARARVVLVGIRLPPNYGMDYTEKFRTIYRDLAQRYRAPLVPFLLEGFAEKQEYFQPDGIHPAAAAQTIMLDNVWPALKPLLTRQTTP